MKIFLSFRFTGEDPAELDKELTEIKKCLMGHGHEVMCTFWDEAMFQKQGFGHKQIMDHGLNYLDGSDAVLAYVKNGDKSEGMLLELGYAMAKGKPVILAIHNEATLRFTQSVAERVFKYDNVPDLISKLGNL